MKAINFLFRGLLVIGVSTLLVGCSTEDGISPAGNEPSPAAVMDETAFSHEPVDASIYAHDASWTDHDGEAAGFAAFNGRPVVLSMIFTNCANACPMIVNDMKRIGELLPSDVKDRAAYVLVSLDPDRDTPNAMRRFAEGHALDLNRWTLLRGRESDVRTLAALLGVRYRAQADGQIAHTSTIAVLNQEGEMVFRHTGSGGTFKADAELFDQIL